MFEDRERVRIVYTNHKGKTSERVIVPMPDEGDMFWFGTTDFHKSPQWLLDAWDVEKGVHRTFAARDILNWEPYQEGSPVFRAEAILKRAQEAVAALGFKIDDNHESGEGISIYDAKVS